jgi:hypothetical protein
VDRKEVIRRFIEGGTILPEHMTREEMIEATQRSKEDFDIDQELEYQVGHPLRTSEELLEAALSHRGVWSIDVEIRPLIWTLNEKGYVTIDSCTGGEKEGHYWEDGYITILRESMPHISDFTEVRRIIKTFTSTPFKIHKKRTMEDTDEDTNLILFSGSVRPR